MLYLDKLPLVPSPNQLKENHLFYYLFKKVEEEHLMSYNQSELWLEIPMQEVRLTNA
jgi:hypothetical protein